MSQRLLALDQSSKCTGYAVFVDGKLEKYGKFQTDHESIGERLVFIRKKVQDLILEYRINQVIFEDIQQQNNVANNVQTFKILAEVYGVISELLTYLQIPYSTVLAVEWKSTLKIKGKQRAEQKKNAQQFVFETYGAKATQDESDAICIGTHYIKQQQSN